MPRKHLIKTSKAPYHVTARSNNKEFFYIPIEELWKMFIDAMEEAKKHFHCSFHAFVLMSNHYHMLISTPQDNLDLVMNYLQREVARKANKRAQRINHFFGGPYKWSLIHEETYYWNALKYVFRNPVRAGICESVIDYRFSSLNTTDGVFEKNLIDFFNDQSKQVTLDLDWLNEPFLNEIEIKIGAALRRREFKIPCNVNGHRPALDMPLPKKGRPT